MAGRGARRCSTSPSALSGEESAGIDAWLRVPNYLATALFVQFSYPGLGAQSLRSGNPGVS